MTSHLRPAYATNEVPHASTSTFLALAVLTACQRASDETVVVVLGQEYGSNLEQDERSSIEKFLSEHSRLPVRVEVLRGPEGIEAVGAEKADIALLKVFEYLVARTEYGASARLQVLRHGGARSYRGEVLTLASSGIRTLSDLDQKSVAYVDPHSTSGFIFPAKLFADARIHVRHEFAESHEAALARLRRKDVDAIATYQGAVTAASDVEVIATTPEIPNEPVFARAGPKKDRIERVLTALSAYCATDTGRAVLERAGGITGFAPTDDATYDPLRTAIDAAGTTVFDLVPGGWQIRRSNHTMIGP